MCRSNPSQFWMIHWDLIRRTFLTQVILTFALDNKPRKLSRTEDSACTASWGLDLLSLHFIATTKQTQGAH